MDLYIFIADAWGAKYGGINSFNYALVIACSRVAKKKSNTKICCVVPCLSKQENEQMLKDGIIPPPSPSVFHFPHLRLAS